MVFSDTNDSSTAIGALLLYRKYCNSKLQYLSHEKYIIYTAVLCANFCSRNFDRDITELIFCGSSALDDAVVVNVSSTRSCSWLKKGKCDTR